jgi:copper chaperone
MSEVILTIEGMHCGACVRRITQSLQRVPGAEVKEVRIGAARVNADDPAPLLAAVAKAGYTAHAEQQ